MSRGSDRQNMTRSAIRSVCNSLLEHSLILVPAAALLIYLPSYRFAALILCIAFYYLIVKDQSAVLASLILLCFLIRIPCGDSEIRQGQVIEVKANYVIVKDRMDSILVYTKAMPAYDSVIAFDGISEPLHDGKGFFRFPFARYCRLKGIRYSVSPDTIREVRPTHSLRGLLMNRIRSAEPETAEMLLEVLFHCSSDDELFQGLFRDRGVSLAGILLFSDLIMQYFCYESTRKKIRIILTVLLAVFYRVPYVMLIRLIRYCLEAAGLKGKAKNGSAFLISLRLCPYAIFNASFLLPLTFAFCSNDPARKAERLFFSMHMSSALFHRVNPIELLLFRLILPVSGFCWICALLEALFRLPFHGLILFLDHILTWVNSCSLSGTILGAGLPFYVLLQTTGFRNTKQNAWYRIALFLLFQMFGLFHPFAELSFINVGQGDSILVRGPFRSSDILIDTGKPSQKNNVVTFLEAKGIRTLNTLIITHADSDHAGSQEVITDVFAPIQVITDHQPELRCGMLTLLDLNDMNSEDENESSIVTAFSLNGMNILLMGDSSVNTEERIVHRYPGLRADILKLSHHGSKTGSSERFLNTVRPDLAIVSSGAYHIYHHPSPEVVQRLNDRRIPYLDTKEEGDITILCLPGLNLLLTASGKIAIIRV